jgi:asparagine synthase (glutamine-hydrolysing)
LGVGNVPQWSKVGAARGVRSLREAYLLQRALGPEVIAAARMGLPDAAWTALPSEGPSAFGSVRDLEVAFYLRTQLLRDADVFSSANSVELRVPFLDREVVRQAWRVPEAHHVGPYAARKALLKTLLHAIEPAHPVGGTKRGFVFPWAEWLHGPLGERVAATLADRDAHEALGMDPASGQAMLEAFRRRDRRVGWASIWSRFVLVEWYWRAELDRVPVPEKAIA